MLAGRPVTTLAADAEFSMAAHAPMHAGRRGADRREVESGGVAAHAFLFREAGDGQFLGLARDRRTGTVCPNPVLGLEVDDFPEAGWLTGALVGIHGPADRRWEKEVSRIAVLAGGPDVVGLLPFSTNDQRD